MGMYVDDCSRYNNSIDDAASSIIDSLISGDQCSFVVPQSPQPSRRRTRKIDTPTTPGGVGLNAALQPPKSPLAKNPGAALQRSSSTMSLSNQAARKRFLKYRNMFMKIAFMVLLIKIMKPDFSLHQSHDHDQSRFLRGNNILMDTAVFTPRFVKEVYHDRPVVDDEEEGNGDEGRIKQAKHEGKPTAPLPPNKK